MRNARMLLVCVLLLMAVSGISSAEEVATWTSKVTVLVENGQGDLLWSYTFMSGGNIKTEAPLRDPLSLEFRLVPEGLWGHALFSKIPLLENVGNTVWISGGSTSYNLIEQRLGDGRPDRLFGFFAVKAAGYQVGGGQFVVRETAPPGGCVSLTIARIGLRIDEVSITRQEVAIPEPAGMASILCGLVGTCSVVLRRRWRERVGIEPTQDLTQTPHRF